MDSLFTSTCQLSYATHVTSHALTRCHKPPNSTVTRPCERSQCKQRLLTNERQAEMMTFYFVCLQTAGQVPGVRAELQHSSFSQQTPEVLRKNATKSDGLHADATRAKVGNNSRIINYHLQYKNYSGTCLKIL